MTKFEMYTAEKEYCESMAKTFYDNGDVKMSQFYWNAALGFKMKQDKLSIQEAGETI